jgi:endonuclease/exonuclease/phosphatase family metal-dependent hydrolase
MGMVTRRLFHATIAACLLAGCSVLPHPALEPAAKAICRSTEPPTSIHWISNVADRSRLDSWCAGVGAVLFRSTGGPLAAPDRPRLEDVAFVSWNVHVGAGNVEGLIADLRSGRLANAQRVRHIVLLIQEAVRSNGVPFTIPRGAQAAKWIGPQKMESTDIDDVARKLDLSVLYVPSMRNGSVPERDRLPSDRGNAILSTVPLFEPVAIELAGARQRRVAVAARIVTNTADGELPLVVSSAHLNVLGSARTFWIFGAASTRAEQARSLLRALPDGPSLLGADLNSWEGSEERAVRGLSDAFPSTPRLSKEATFRGGLVLDRLFFRLPKGWRGRVTRAPERYGSDHYPIIGTISREPLLLR